MGCALIMLCAHIKIKNIRMKKTNRKKKCNSHDVPNTSIRCDMENIDEKATVETTHKKVLDLNFRCCFFFIHLVYPHLYCCRRCSSAVDKLWFLSILSYVRTYVDLNICMWNNFSVETWETNKQISKQKKISHITIATLNVDLETNEKYQEHDDIPVESL